MKWKQLAVRPLIDAAGRARTREYRRVHRQVLEDVPGVCDALETMGRRWTLPPSPRQDPVFLLAAGWRSGSTAAQRLIMSNGDTLMWGEPYARCGYIQQMAEALRAFDTDYPREDYLLANRQGDLTEQWIANLFPGVEDVKAAHRAFFDRLLADPASNEGYRRWGVKEVRLDAGHACYLRWLYPDAKLVLLVRDPLAAYRSYLHAGPAFARWPEEAVITPTEFGRLWARLSGSFVKQGEALGARLIRWEDLIDPKTRTISDLEEYLGSQFDRRVLDRPIGGSRPATTAPPLSRLDRQAILTATEPVAVGLGYGPAAGADGQGRLSTVRRNLSGTHFAG